MRKEHITNGKLTAIKAKNQTELQNYLVPYAYNQSAYKTKETLFVATDILRDDFSKQFSLLEDGELDRGYFKNINIDKRKPGFHKLKLSSFIGNYILLDFSNKSKLRKKENGLDFPALQDAISNLKIELLIIEDINALLTENYYTKESILLNLYFLSRKHNIQIVFGDLAPNHNNLLHKEIIDNVLIIDDYGFSVPINKWNYEFTPEKIKKIEELNNKIRNEEIRMKNFYLKNKRLFNKWINKELIDDVNMFDTRLSLFSYDEEFNKNHCTEMDDPFYDLRSVGVLTSFNDDDFFNTNWNEFQFQDEHPLKSLYMCYTMHCMVFDTYILSWDDILHIDDIWMEFNVDFQFFTDKRTK